MAPKHISVSTPPLRTYHSIARAWLPPRTEKSQLSLVSEATRSTTAVSGVTSKLVGKGYFGKDLQIVPNGLIMALAPGTSGVGD